MPKCSPTALPSSDLKFSAKIDYVTVSNWGIKIPLPELDGKHFWVRNKGSDWCLTIHDPSLADVQTVHEIYENPGVEELEISIDLTPKVGFGPLTRKKLLISTFDAVAARFRPEDEALWSYGARGAVAGRGKPIEPLERRMANLGEELVYGHRGGYMQAKLYFKTRDQDMDLPESRYSVRMEIRLRKGACMDERIAINKLYDLIGYSFRAQFTKHFRLIEKPEVRKLRGLTAKEFNRRTKRMERAWRTAGVAKFAIPLDFPPDTLIGSKQAIARRQKAQLPAAEYKLKRDQVANSKIGAALMNLQRRFSG
jgi:hypothetical protein